MVNCVSRCKKGHFWSSNITVRWNSRDFQRGVTYCNQ